MESCLHWRTGYLLRAPTFCKLPWCSLLPKDGVAVPMRVGKQSCFHNLPPTETPDRYFRTSVPYPLHASQPRKGRQSYLPEEGCSGLPKASFLRVLLCSSHRAQSRGTEPCGQCQSICDVHRVGRTIRHLNNNHHVKQTPSHSFLPLLSLTLCTLPHEEASCRASYQGLPPQYLSVRFDSK